MATPSPPPTYRFSALIGSRGRRIAHTGMWSLIAKICAAGNLFISVPFVLHSLGPAQFGAWATLVSLITFAGFLDFGFGNGAMNLVAAAYGRNSSAEIATILDESRRALIGIAGGLAAIASIALPVVPWQHMLGMPESMSSMSREAVAAVLFSVIFAVPLNLANRIQLGLGRGDRAFRWQAIGQLAALAVVIALAKADASLAALTAAAVATPLLASIANTYSLWRDPSIRATSSPTLAERTEIRHRVRRDGMLFFVLQLAASLAFTADLPLISALRSPSDAGTYAIVQRLFSVIPLGLSLIWAPLWPIYRQALAANHHGWVKRTLRQSIVLAVMFSTVLAAILALGFNLIIGLWIHRSLAISGALLGGFAFWCVIEAAGTAMATFLNAAGVMRYQAIIATAFAAICLCAKTWAIQEFGMVAIPWVTIVTYSLVSVLPLIWFGSRIFVSVFAKKY
ncbi:MAG: lipopolysaccharide biosynthesis protein [Terriglobales bacterium]